MKKQIGKNTIGGGGKMSVKLKSYERSTHNKSYIWRSTMAPGTLVPFMKEVALRGDTWDINLEASVLTHPTIGPLFGSFKLQLDVFTCDIRLYQGKLHNNTLNTGLAMNTIKLPNLYMQADPLNWTKNVDTQQINPSCIFKYLGISGIGNRSDGGSPNRYFNAVPFLAYWDIVKNYYANKQETNGAVIHNTDIVKSVTAINVRVNATDNNLTQEPEQTDIKLIAPVLIRVAYTAGNPPDLSTILITMGTRQIPLNTMFSTIVNNSGANNWELTDMYPEYNQKRIQAWSYAIPEMNTKPQILKFPLVNLDTMREDILTATKVATPFLINSASIAPYGQPLKKEGNVWSKTTSQEGLALKTYQSDVLQNWIKTEWISGANSINDITKISTAGGSFTIDDLTLKRKIYNMLNAVAVSGGSYDDWMDVNYEEAVKGKTEIPEYQGGLSKEIVFQEVVSNSASAIEGEQPLGTLAGRGVLGKKHKGGYVRVKPTEICYLMGIVSITPRIDYSQGNDWDVNLTSMDDFHKPALDGIGFQDLITEQMAYWDTDLNGQGVATYRSAGKQPAWINYMTSYNRTYGNFAIENDQMFMTLNRRYQPNPTTKRINDLTTYIDPQLYNHIFAYTKRDAQNFWVQLGVNIEVRRLMSAKIMPQG